MPVMQHKRKRFTIAGQVQGVGFRPFVFRTAVEHGLTGHVRNSPLGVVLEVQGDVDALASFASALLNQLPPLASISSLQEEDAPAVSGEKSFIILPSDPGLAHDVLISPDAATCADCLADMRDPANRRHGYAFTNCTNCGPRYTITRSMPYDRPQTSMACFELCPECAAEYSNPADRRFHAQPNACPKCGPRLFFVCPDQAGDLRLNAASPATPVGAQAYNGEALQLAVNCLISGEIVAVKGLGGFHLVCDASSSPAVKSLRERKNRPHKPLAVMTADLADAELIAAIGPEERKLLESVQKPIVLCPARPGSPLAPEISPDTPYVGIMLPYTPLHHLLLEAFKNAAGKTRPAALVMTSGNMGGEPICLGNREAVTRLSGIADAFLLHNRDILVRSDDSVVRPLPLLPEDAASPEDAPVMFLRRARGYVPSPLPLPGAAQNRPPILALGAELKNTLTVTRGDLSFTSQHIGDLNNMETQAFQEEIARHLCGVLQVKPELAICDQHPDFSSKALADVLGLPCITLQHHLAHAESVLAENGRTGESLVLALDGSGYAPDGTIWGGELLFLHPAANMHQRLGRLGHLRLPGGDAAILEPWRTAAAALCALGLDPTAAYLPWMTQGTPDRNQPVQSVHMAEAAALIPQMLAKGVNSPSTSSAGRLFDAASALLGLCLKITYEGQAAIRLESAQGGPGEDFYADFRRGRAQALPATLESGQPESELVLDCLPMLRAVHERFRNGVPARELARAFHWSLAERLADLALAGSKICGTRHVGLSGGVLQNVSLLLLLKEHLRERGLIPLTHRALPPNDGCISHGQAVYAARLRPDGMPTGQK